MTSRDERLQQRLRGAATRQVGDVDFGLVFAPVVEEPPVNPSEGQSAAPELPAPRSARRQAASAPQASKNDPSSTPKSQKQLSHNANTSAKLRKLVTDPPNSSRSTRSSQRITEPDIYTLVDDSLPKPTDAIRNSQALESGINESVISEAALELTPTRAVEVVAESPSDAPGSGRRLRTVEKVRPASSGLRNTPKDSLEDELSSPIVPKKRKRKLAITKELSPDLSQDVRGEEDIDELSPEQPRRRVKRKPVVEESLLPDVDEAEEAEEINDEQAAVFMGKNKRRRSSRIIPAASPELSHTTPVVRRRKAKPQHVSSPVQQRQPKANQMSKKHQPKPKSVRIGSPIPVTVHRLTACNLVEGDDSDADILNAPIPRPKQGDPNAIDVLSQVCLEIITAALEDLSDLEERSEDATYRREVRMKKEGVEAYGREIQTRLLEHTINLDNGESLQRRLRDAQKRKLHLREQISEIRAEREKVALNMDMVRIRHENETATALRRDNLNNAVQDVELAVELGRASQGDDNKMIGTELLLKRIAGQVSTKGGSGGLLRQIKEANAFLERTALVLEGRKV